MVTATDEEVEVYLDHMADIGEEYLEHFGIKGMQWGVRKQKLQRGARKFGAGARRAWAKPGVRAAVKTGAITTAAILAGGIGAMAVSSLMSSLSLRGGTVSSYTLPQNKTVIGSPNNPDPRELAREIKEAN
jgi:hypothetical protein